MPTFEGSVACTITDAGLQQKIYVYVQIYLCAINDGMNNKVPQKFDLVKYS
jgi:hypothetical protein